MTGGFQEGAGGRVCEFEVIDSTGRVGCANQAQYMVAISDRTLDSGRFVYVCAEHRGSVVRSSERPGFEVNEFRL
jgi:hypothetical protein